MWYKKTPNSIQQTWAKVENLVGIKNNGSGLAGKEDSEWFKIINPVFTDNNDDLNNLCPKPTDPTLVSCLCMDEFSLRWMEMSLFLQGTYLALLDAFFV